MSTHSNFKPQQNLFTNNNHESPLSFQGEHGEIIAYSRGNIKNCNSNEDSAAIVHLSPQHTILIVADGLGGHAEGAKASKYAVEALCKELVDNKADNIEAVITESLNTSNQCISRWQKNAGTTIAISEVLNNKVRTFHAGDSEILIYGSKGKVCMQTVAHSPIGYAIESGTLSEEDAMLHPDRHYISNYLGQESMHICVSRFKKMKPRDTLILATDGLFDNLTKQEVADTIRIGDLLSAGENLQQTLHNKMIDFENHIVSKPDDMTFILFRLNH